MIEVNVCIGTACHLRGSYNVVQTFQQMIEPVSYTHLDVYKRQSPLFLILPY